jgi:protein NrfC
VSDKEPRLSRRDFLKLTSSAAIGVGVLGYGIPRLVMAEGVAVIPVSKGYLLVDSKKCSGCMSCMLACSLVHEGKENLSLSRIQIIQNPFGEFPADITMAQCRQCVNPLCVEACSNEALYVDRKHGNVRTVNKDKCIACMECIEACPFTPSRSLYDFEAGHAQKCDLCAEAPFWGEPGGPDGKQACVEVCPVRAIKFTDKVPLQKGDGGYDINLRNENWKKLGFPI